MTNGQLVCFGKPPSVQAFEFMSANSHRRNFPFRKWPGSSVTARAIVYEISITKITILLSAKVGKIRGMIS